jgi:hypothetical protein
MLAKAFQALRTALPLLAATGVVACGTSKTEEPSSDRVSRLVYAVRQHTELDSDGNVVNIDVAGGMGQVMDYARYVPGGRLEILDLSNGEIDNVIADYPEADVASVDVSFDGSKVLFSMKRDREDSYHIYWASLTPANGAYELHQLTFGPFDDQNAVYLPGGRIAFTTNQAYTPMGTRADEYNHARVPIGV